MGINMIKIFSPQSTMLFKRSKVDIRLGRYSYQASDFMVNLHFMQSLLHTLQNYCFMSYILLILYLYTFITHITSLMSNDPGEI